MMRAGRFFGTYWRLCGILLSLAGFTSCFPRLIVPSSQLDGSSSSFTPGVGWTLRGAPAFSSGTATEPAIAIDPATGYPWVYFSDVSVGGRGTVMKFDGSAWVLVGIKGFTVGP